jgi:hypothetical protein
MEHLVPNARVVIEKVFILAAIVSKNFMTWEATLIVKRVFTNVLLV